MDRAEFKHRIELPVLWGHLDAFGHVNNVVFFRYLEQARVAYFEWLTGSQLSATQSIVLADMQCSFRQQLHYPATVEVLSRISRLGGSSLDLTSAIYRQGEGTPVATAKAILVWFDFASQAASRVPDDFRERIRSHEVTAPLE